MRKLLLLVQILVVGVAASTGPTYGAAFTQACSTRAFPTAATPIDGKSVVEGSGGNKTNQNQAKNNFYAAGAWVPIED
ncbi:MAG: hypothetical protein EPO08_19420 [Rhodospirillaceae bacterium]|nr:MAG: hypothetical protein EPO08_19420 [Rhodospirillaceae bacterium]